VTAKAAVPDDVCNQNPSSIAGKDVVVGIHCHRQMCINDNSNARR